MISIPKVKENKNKMLDQFKKLKWTHVKNKKEGIKFIQDISQNKIININKNINRKKNMLQKINKDIKKCEIDIIKINNYINDKSSIIRQKKLSRCPICMDKINKNSMILTKCGHLYCNECLLKSLSVKSNCPICREKIDNDNDYITIHYNDTYDYKILKTHQDYHQNDNDNFIIIQNSIRRAIVRTNHRENEINNNNILRNQTRENLEIENIRLRQTIINYNTHLALLENNLMTRSNINYNNIVLNAEPIIDDYENVINTYPQNRSRRYLNSMAQRDLIIRIQKNLVNSLKSHIRSLREYIDIQNHLIDND